MATMQELQAQLAEAQAQALAAQARAEHAEQALVDAKAPAKVGVTLTAQLRAVGQTSTPSGNALFTLTQPRVCVTYAIGAGKPKYVSLPPEVWSAIFDHADEIRAIA